MTELVTEAPTASASSRPRGQGGTALLVLVSIVWLAITATSPWPGAYLLIWVLFLVAAVPTLREFRTGQLDVFVPITAIRIMYFVYFGVAAVYELHTPEKRRLNVVIEDGIHRGLACAIVALLMLQIGNAMAAKWTAKTTNGVTKVHTEDWNRVFKVIVGVWLIGIATRLYGVSQGFHIRFAATDTYGVYSGADIFIDYLGFLSTFGYVMMMAYSFVAPKARAARLLAWGAMLPAQLFFALLGGPKQYFIPIIVAPLICFHYLRRKLPVSRMLFPLGLFALVVFPIMTAYRSLDSIVIRNIAFQDQIQYAVGGVSTLLVERGLSGYLAWGLGLMVERMDGIYTLTGVLLGVPGSMEFQWGKTLTVGFAMLIPTFVWPGKYDYMSSVITWGERIFDVPPGGSGISITHPGELFLNFGFPGVVVGMFFLGAGFRALHALLVTERRFFGVVILAILWPTLVVPEYPFASYFSDGFKQAVLLFVISLVAGARWRRTKPRSTAASGLPART